MSGPDGERPAGEMRFTADGRLSRASVACVRVVGRNALITGDLGHHFRGGLDGMGFYIEDRSPVRLSDRIAVFFFSTTLFNPSNACNVLPFGPSSGSLEAVHGHFTVSDNQLARGQHSRVDAG